MPVVTWSIKPQNIAYLTYAQYNGDPIRSVSDIQSSLAILGVSHCLVGHEFHQDGGHHYHVVCRWEDGYATRDPRVFDVDGHHPNYQCVRGRDHIKRVVEYCTKDGDFYGDPDEFLDIPKGPGRDEIWSSIIGAGNIDEFWRLVRELAPYEYVTGYDRLSSYASAHYGRAEAYVPDFTVFDTPGVLDDWVRDNLVCAPALATRRGPLINDLLYYTS